MKKLFATFGFRTWGGTSQVLDVSWNEYTTHNMKYVINRPSKYDEIDYLEEIKRVDLLVNKKTLTKKEYGKHAIIHYTTITNHFPDWKTALEKAGIGHKYSGKSITNKQREQVGKKLKNPEILAELKRISLTLNKDELTNDDINSQSKIIGTYLLRSRFGNVKTALIEAGLNITKHGKRYTNKECYENLENVWTYYGRQPTYAEIEKPPSIVGGKAYEIRWGTWIKALEAFVKYMESDDEPSEHISSTRITNTLKLNKIKEEDRRNIRKGLRWKILERDSFSCVLCGSNTKNNPGCKLHVDHIKPFIKGGKTVFDNLQTLCSFCNLGKSDKFHSN